MTEVIAILVSVGLVLVTNVSAVLVWRTKQQARQAATRARTEAVNYLREAQSDLKNDRSVTPQAVVSLRKAKNLADVVFSKRDSPIEADYVGARRLSERYPAISVGCCRFKSCCPDHAAAFSTVSASDRT
jgi:hypothetical protein